MSERPRSESRTTPPATPRATPRVTHSIDVGADRVRKTFRDHDRGEAEREWFGLVHLARHAPGLAPQPLATGVSEDPAWIEMSRLSGATPSVWTEADHDAVVTALARLWAVPAAGAPEQYGSPAFDPTFWRRLLAATPEPTEPPLRDVYREAWRWLNGTDVDRLLTGGGPVIFGQGDPNVDNILLDRDAMGHRTARLVDFEDAGRSRRSFELANVIEHLANRDCGFASLADRFDVPAAELRQSRRLVAIYWFARLVGDPVAAKRNLPGQVVAQAERLQSLLDSAPSV